MGTSKYLVCWYRTLVKRLKMKQKHKKDGFLSMLLGALGASLLGNLLTAEGKIRADEDTVTTGYDF